MKCRICGSEHHHNRFTIREMMLGTREEFEYFQCAACDCLQIAAFPEDIAPYYADGYYSFDGNPDARHMVVQRLYDARTRYYIEGRGLFGALVARQYPNFILPKLEGVISSKNDRILDIGCGTGMDLHSLRSVGYVHTLGADPFIEGRIEYRNGLIIERKSIFEIEPAWDVILMSHSLEHMPDQHATMQRVRSLLTQQGTAVISIPVVPSEAWEIYGSSWIQADAPRHFFLHSLYSFTLLAEQAGFIIERVVYDSGAFQFFGSELYRRDIAYAEYERMNAPQRRKLFSSGMMKQYSRRATELNRIGRGDQLTAYLKPAAPREE